MKRLALVLAIALLGGCGLSRERVHLVVRDSRALIRAGRAQRLDREQVWLRGAEATLPNLDALWQETGGVEEDAREDAAIAALASRS